jgi:hypothetical protein
VQGAAARDLEAGGDALLAGFAAAAAEGATGARASVGWTAAGVALSGAPRGRPRRATLPTPAGARGAICAMASIGAGPSTSARSPCADLAQAAAEQRPVEMAAEMEQGDWLHPPADALGAQQTVRAVGLAG